MKKLSDYKGDEAIELWADLLEPITGILSDKAVADTVKSGKAVLMIAREVLKTHKNDAAKILLRIDNSPLDGLNILLRLAELIKEISESEELKSFFGFPVLSVKTDNASSGSVTENTEVAEN